jgi:malate synthase|tara:strand:+ start:6235 stop:7803 length:1569 start_codon:yes stop_codon:yes gene_type:complete
LNFKKELNKSSKLIFSKEAKKLLEVLHNKFNSEIDQLLDLRKSRQQKNNDGHLPSFNPETKDIRESSWKVRDIPKELLDRRLEITGPVDRKMMINALNSNVSVFMADFEDSLSPTWENIQNGIINMKDAADGTIAFTHRVTLKEYSLNENPAILMCRVRGLHLKEKHIEIEGQSIYGALVDFAMYLFHNHQSLADRNTGPYFYIPKLESGEEAKLWSKIICFCEDYLKLKRGTVKVTCLVETLPAVFQMHEILYYLKDHIVGLNCGRWDYIFSYIKTLQCFPDRILPDRSSVTMSQPFLNAYSKLLVDTCHSRGAIAMGGMAAFVPSKDLSENERIFEKVKQDKLLEINNGHDGTWIAHPGLANHVNTIFDTVFSGNKTNQIYHFNGENFSAEHLLEPCKGYCTEQSLRANIKISLRYIEAWLEGLGCVAIYGLMEDAATAEISRTSIWQWIKHKVKLSNGKLVTPELVSTLFDEEFLYLKNELGSEAFENGKFYEAKSIFKDLVLSNELEDFLTIRTYEEI